MASEEPFGKRVARLRRLRGLSQTQLAELIDRSPAWMSQVERGQRQIDRMSVLETLAQALDVPLADLAADRPVIAAQQPVNDHAERLRVVLLTCPLIPASDSDFAFDSASASDGLAQAWNLVHAGDYAGLPDVLGSMLADLERACGSLPQDERPWTQLASAYHAMAAAFAKLGEPDGAWIATDRAIHAARAAGDATLVAASAFRLAVVFQGARRYDYVELAAAAVAEPLRDRLDVLDDPTRSVWGALTLQRAVAAARRNDAERAYALLEDARAVAALVGEGRNDFHTEFGPLNVQLHEVSVSVDLGDAGRALRVAEGVNADALSPERRTRFLVDIARAQMQRRDVEQSVAALLAAESLSPQLVYDHYFARQIISDLLAVADDPPVGLRDLARRAKVLRP